MTTYLFQATAPHGTEDLLAAEVEALGGREIASLYSGVSFCATLATAYRVCLWSRVASRVLLPLGHFPAATPEELYAGAREIAWEDHLHATGTLAVDGFLRRSQINHSRFAALKVKDAIVDRFRDRCGERPSVRPDRPDVQISLRIDKDEATLALDLSGESLHRRGYRCDVGVAPLKENLAAAILLRAGWPALAHQGKPLLDPLCGSGTLLLEGAMIAADVAPGLLRPYFGFLGWSGHDGKAWQALLAEAQERRTAGMEDSFSIFGCDRDPKTVGAALSNIRKAGLEGRVRVECRDFSEWLPALARQFDPGGGGMIVANPPYGERLGDIAQLRVLYTVLGDLCRHHFPGWQLSVFSGNTELVSHLGLRAAKAHSLRNGPIKARLFHYFLRSGEDSDAAADGGSEAPRPRDRAAEMFANRLRKNLKTTRRWAEREGVSCYRLYDADLPEYAVAVDWYEGRVHVQEYQAPSSVAEGKARRRLQDALRVATEVLQVAPEHIYLKQRRRQKGASQYGKVDDRSQFFQVNEGPCRFWVNLSDYLDTGLFLDHRPVRRRLMGMAAGKRFLNLFGYTGAASVFAARGGAAATTTVDASRTYLDWAKRNFDLNQMEARSHRIVRSDVLEWLQRTGERFDLIFLDPPTFSNSKDRAATFDVQRDHVSLIFRAMAVLAPQGVLIFSTNHRKFRLEGAALDVFSLEEITTQTIPWDFRRRPGIHRCWLIGKEKK